MSQRQHTRSGSHGRKVVSSHSRSSTKPPPLIRRGHSHTSTLQSNPTSPSKSHSSAGRRDNDIFQMDDNDEDSTAGFLQFCATCEKQIVAPGQVLYCSSACRRRDVTTIDLTNTVLPSPPLTPLTTYYDPPQYPHIDIIPQRSPTVLQPLSSCFGDLSLSEQAWSGAYAFDGREHSQQHSQSSSRSFSTLPTSSSSSELASQHQPAARRGYGTRASADNGSYIPSLSHSPSSSYSTLASNASYQRPRISRHNPYSSSSFTAKSIDLVLPCPVAASTSQTTTTGPVTFNPSHNLASASMKSSASTLTSFRVAEAEKMMAVVGRRATAPDVSEHRS